MYSYIVALHYAIINGIGHAPHIMYFQCVDNRALWLEIMRQIDAFYPDILYTVQRIEILECTKI
jgi:hypothetical protein